MLKSCLLGLALAALSMTTLSSSASAQRFECPSAGATCEVDADEMRLNFAGIGVASDVIVLGTMDYLLYRHFVACVNGVVQFAQDPNGAVRAHLDQNSVLCTSAGDDQITVLRSNQTYPCSLAGFPVTLGALNYNGKELKIHSGTGNDTVRGGDGVDRICGGMGNDTIFGMGGRNELQGGEGNDYLEGSYDTDWIFGASGDDILWDLGTGGYRGDCNVLDKNRTPSRMEGGEGNDCLDLPPSSEPGWCYRQEESCGGSTGVLCHAGLWCGAGPNDRIDTDTRYGLGCETRTNGNNCPRRSP